MKIPLGQYISSASDVLASKDLQSTAIGTWIVAIIALSILGAVVGSIMDSKK